MENFKDYRVHKRIEAEVRTRIASLEVGQQLANVAIRTLYKKIDEFRAYIGSIK